MSGNGEASLEALGAGGRRLRELRDGKADLIEQRNSRRRARQADGLDENDTTQGVIREGTNHAGTTLGDFTQTIKQMEAEHLAGQIAKEGIAGGTSLRTLGSGAMGETHVASFGGEEKVFKEDAGTPQVMADAGAELELSSSRSVASSAVNDLLGSRVLGKTEFAEMDGKRGIAMPFARGTATREEYAVDWTGREAMTQQELPFANPSTLSLFKSKGDLDFSDPVLQRELIELQINDMISAQVDRHGGNYHVEKDETGAVLGVNAFDNDGAFGHSMIDWNNDVERGGLIHPVKLPPLINRDQANRINAIDLSAMSARLHELLPTEEVQAAMWRVIELQNHVAQLEADGRIIDQFDAESYRILREAGAKHSYVARDALAKEQMDAVELLINPR